jgi:hypothetical protein
MIQNDAIRDYFPIATAKLAKEPFYSTYWTYQQWQAFVKKCSEENRWGFPGHYSAIFEPVGNKFIGMIGLMFHNSPMGQEYLVTFTPTSGAHDQVNLGHRPLQSYYLKDLDTAYALMIAIAYPAMAMWESFLKGGDRDAAIKKYVDMVPGWCNFTGEQEAQFVRNLVIGGN